MENTLHCLARWRRLSGVENKFIVMVTWLVAARLTGVASQVDSRCFLTEGGSSETFTVNEAVSVDSVIGTLQIVGDPSETGDIELQLAQHSAPVAIQPFSSNLILKQKLDKEGEEGVRGVNVDVVCTKKSSSDQSITIPVRIIVTDANDNAPEFIGAPYFVNISEVTVVRSTVLQGIKATDRDQPGPFSTVQYFVEDGPYKHFLAFENPLEGSLVLTAPLDYETVPTFTVTLKAQDQGDHPQSVYTTLTVNVLDADDQNPRFLAERYSTQLPFNPRPGTLLATSPAPIRAEDPDVGVKSPIEYVFNSDSLEYSYFELNRRTGVVSIRRTLPNDVLLPVTLVVRATQVDNPDRFTLTTLTISARGRTLPTELKFLQSDYVTTVLESTPPGHTVLTVQTSKSTDKNIRFMILDNSMEEFAIRTTGEVIIAKALDYERQQMYAFRILASDGRQSDMARVNITVMNVNDNDPTFGQNQYTFLVTESDIRTGSLVGQIEVSDGDENDLVELNIKGPFSRVFTISSRGELRIRNLDFLNSSICHLIVVATDNGTPPRQASIPVTVQFPEELIMGNILKPKKQENSFVLMIVFGILLGMLLIIIITLTVYILKNKQYRDRLPNAIGAVNHSSPNKLSTYTPAPTQNGKGPDSQGDMERPNGVENPIFNMADDGRDQSEESRLARKTTLSGCLKNNSISAVGSINIPGAAPNHVPQETNLCTSFMNGHIKDPDSISNKSKISNIQWPNGSIPRRVKKLSWEDEQHHKTELDPDVSVTPLSKPQRSPHDRPDLTVYF